MELSETEDKEHTRLLGQRKFLGEYPERVEDEMTHFLLRCVISRQDKLICLLKKSLENKQGNPE